MKAGRASVARYYFREVTMLAIHGKSVMLTINIGYQITSISIKNALTNNNQGKPPPPTLYYFSRTTPYRFNLMHPFLLFLFAREFIQTNMHIYGMYNYPLFVRFTLC